MNARNLITFLTLASFLAACSLTPAPVRQNNASTPTVATNGLVRPASYQTRSDSAQLESITFPNLVPPQPLEQASNLPAGQAISLDFVTGTPTTQQIKMPANGEFKLITEAGDAFQVVDQDASTDRVAKVILPRQTYDIFIRPEPVNSGGSTSCPTPAPTTATGNQLLDQLDQAVLNKANALVAAGQSQCVYLPPQNQRQNANCNSTSTGLQCSGPLNKTIQAAQCPEIAVYGGAMNLNHALTNSKLFVAVQNNLTLNQSAKGILATRGDLNTSLNNTSQLQGVFVGARSNNLNLGGTTRIQGLYSVLNNGSLSMNLNQSARFEGELCMTGQANINRNGSSQFIYDPNQVGPWQSDLPMVTSLMCVPGSRPYTQVVQQTCAMPVASGNASMKLEDSLYYVNQTLIPTGTGEWQKLAGRPLPIPTDWHNSSGTQYVLTLSNSGLNQISSRWLPGQTAIFPLGIKEIGPDGGNIQLPGVGELDIPAGALVQPIIIALKQKHDVLKYPGTVELGPPVTIFPETMTFNKPIYIRVSLNRELVDQIPLSTITYYAKSPDTHILLWDILQLAEEKSPQAFSVNDWYLLNRASEVRVLVEESVFKISGGDFGVTAVPAPPPEYACPPFAGDVPHFKITHPSHWDSIYRDIICMAVEDAWQKYQIHLKKPLPWEKVKYNGKIHYTVPILILDQQGDAIVQTLFPNKRAYTIKIDSVTNTHVNYVDTAYHEIYHTFQYNHVPLGMNVLNNTMVGPVEYINFFDDKKWFFESSARLVGSYSFFSSYGSLFNDESFPYKQFFKLGIEDVLKNFFHFIPLGDSLTSGKDEYFKSLYSFPSSSYTLDNIYLRASLMALIRTKYGVEKIHSMNKEYAELNDFSTFSAIRLMDDEDLGVSIQNSYPNLITHAFLKNYGFGSHTKSNVEYIEKNTRTNLQLPYSLHPISQSNNLVNNKSLILEAENLEGLSSKIHLIRGNNLKGNLYLQVDSLKKRAGPNITQENLESIFASGIRLISLKQGVFDESKPECRPIKASDGKNYCIFLFTLVAQPSGGIKNSLVYLPVDDSMQQTQLALLVTNPRVKLLDSEPLLSLDYKIKVHMGPKIDRIQVLPQDDDSTQSHLLVEGSGFDVNHSWIRFELRTAQAKFEDKKAVVKNLPANNHGEIPQELRVQMPKLAIKDVYISGITGDLGLMSNKYWIDQTVCNILEPGFSLTANQPCLEPLNNIHPGILPGVQ